MSSYEISIPCGNLDTDTNTSTRQYRRRLSTRMNVSVSADNNINRGLKFLSNIFTNTSHSKNLQTEAICRSATEVLYLGMGPIWPIKKLSLKWIFWSTRCPPRYSQWNVLRETTRKPTHTPFQVTVLVFAETMLEQSYTWRDWEVGSLMLSVSSSFQTGSFVLVFTENMSFIVLDSWSSNFMLIEEILR